MGAALDFGARGSGVTRCGWEVAVGVAGLTQPPLPSVCVLGPSGSPGDPLSSSPHNPAQEGTCFVVPLLLASC